MTHYYTTPSETDRPPRQLIAAAGTPEEKHCTFFDRIEIGRYHPNRENTPGLLLVEDPAASSRHCIITQHADGRCFVRDVSRNGTRLEGRRLVPNVESEIKPGQSIQLGFGEKFVLSNELPRKRTQPADLQAFSSTQAVSDISVVTVLVGDIRNYTLMVRQALPAQLQQSVRRVFAELEKLVESHGGTLKEYQGDAIFAFWEKGKDDSYVASACKAALDLDRLARELAEDRSVWAVEGFPLAMDWALATGPVIINTLGGDRPTGLSMIGEAVVLAYRTEKLADDTTGRVLACPVTAGCAVGAFEFKELGDRKAKGFDKPQKIFSLLGQVGT